jgi:DNA-binding SARP family transcriptional activator
MGGRGAGHICAPRGRGEMLNFITAHDRSGHSGAPETASPQRRDWRFEASPLLHVRLLGGFCVERTDSGQVLSYWQRRSAKTLIKVLATHPDHIMHREQFIDILWPRVDADSALNSFGKALHAARRALEPGLPRRQDSAYLRLSDAMLVLNTERVVVDADQFEQLAEAAIRCRDVGAYQAALDSYGGELLPEDRYETWCDERRTVLQELRIRLLAGMAEALEARGAYNDAADRLRDVLLQDPAREAAHRHLMRVYALMGLPDQAVRQFRVCQGVLRRELDLAPRPETVSLYTDITTSRLSPPAPGRDRNWIGSRRFSASQAVDRRPFAGRDRVLKSMMDQLMRCDEAKAGMVVVSGEAGVGKTRLLEEFANRAREHGAVTLCGGRGAHASQFACGPFAVALEDYAASRSETERVEIALQYPALTRFVPSLSAASPLTTAAPDVRGYQLDLVPTIVQFITDLARAKPVLLVLGDLHGADETGLDLIRYLAHLAGRMPLLIVGALRDSEIEADPRLRQMIEAMTRERLWLRLELSCLSRRSTDELVRAMLSDVQVSEDTLAEIYAQSRGNPLFIRELVDTIRSYGVPAPREEGGFYDPSSLAARLQSRTRALVSMRLALMDDPLRRVLGLTAAAGATVISLSHLRAGAAALEPPVAVPALFDALDRALQMRLLEERDGGYAFRHPVLRTALYDCLPRHRRDEFRAALVVPGAGVDDRSAAYRQA